jgi:lipopolysaccharide biosynthesis regulator YciM
MSVKQPTSSTYSEEEYASRWPVKGALLAVDLEDYPDLRSAVTAALADYNKYECRGCGRRTYNADHSCGKCRAREWRLVSAAPRGYSGGER